MGKGIRLVIFQIICLCGFFFSCQKSNHYAQSLFSEDYSLCAGDIVFRQGRSAASRLVLSAEKSGYYSHIGIIVKQDGKWYVVHAVPDEPDFEGDTDRVKMDEINRFFFAERANCGAIMRIDDDTIAYKASVEAIDIFNRNTPFDHKYDLDDTLNMYCTELIYHVYNKQGLDLTEGRRSKVNIPGFRGTYIFPSDIQLNPGLKTIYSF